MLVLTATSRWPLLVLFGLLISYATAAPHNALDIAETSLSASIEPRQAPSASPAAHCVYDNDISYYQYSLVLVNWTPDSRGCGRGLLDNLRGQCIFVTAWRCNNWATPGNSSTETELVTFGISSLAGSCVSTAIHLASYGAVDDSVACLH